MTGAFVLNLKPMLVLLLLVIAAFGCSRETPPNSTNSTVKEEGLEIVENRFSNDGPLLSTGGMKKSPNGGRVQHGHWIYWDKNGRKEREGDYVDGKEDGAWVFFEPATAENWITEQGSFKAGKREGKWQIRMADGSWGEVNYRNGDLHGWCKKDSGEGNYENGVKEGRWVEHPWPQAEYRGRYSGGKKTGYWTERSSGSIDSIDEGTYSDGKRQGKWRQFIGVSGGSWSTVTYEDGVEVSREWDKK